ncbi:MAG: hypothetical protein JHC93_00500 [Parachlamydiales bacterium]|nr:hypothetical protein [Parachlamydiales bacterium]
MLDPHNTTRVSHNFAILFDSIYNLNVGNTDRNHIVTVIVSGSQKKYDASSGFVNPEISALALRKIIKYSMSDYSQATEFRRLLEIDQPKTTLQNKFIPLNIIFSDQSDALKNLVQGQTLIQVQNNSKQSKPSVQVSSLNANGQIVTKQASGKLLEFITAVSASLSKSVFLNDSPNVEKDSLSKDLKNVNTVISQRNLNVKSDFVTDFKQFVKFRPVETLQSTVINHKSSEIHRLQERNRKMQEARLERLREVIASDVKKSDLTQEEIMQGCVQLLETGFVPENYATPADLMEAAHSHIANYHIQRGR